MRWVRCDETNDHDRDTRESAGHRAASTRRSSATRQAILDAALEVFSESGYRSGSLRDIAQRGGHERGRTAPPLPEQERPPPGGARPAATSAPASSCDMESEDGAETLRGLVALARYNASMPGVVELYCTLSAEATAPEHPGPRLLHAPVRVPCGRASTAAFEPLIAIGRLLADVSAPSGGRRHDRADGRPPGAVAARPRRRRHGRRGGRVLRG